MMKRISSEEYDEDSAMLIRKVGKMFYKKGRQSNFRRGRPQGRFEKRREEPDPYFHCKKNGTPNCRLPLPTSYYFKEHAK